jgi:endonuclease YncB( thermonuclease family)
MRKLLFWIAIGAMVFAGFRLLVFFDVIGDSATPVIPDAIPQGSQIATVEWVYDGDTIEVWIDGERATVRLAEIDAPETGANGTTVECYQAEATNRLKELLPVGSNVWLETDQTDHDRYGRLIRFVWRKDSANQAQLVEEELVSGGYAAVETGFVDRKYEEPLQKSEREAGDASAGLWGACH